MKLIKYIIFKIIKLLSSVFIKVGDKKEIYLFVNTGQIGDLVVSSLILENDDLFRNKQLFLLINEKYLDLFKYYSGDIKIISFKHNIYRYSIFYRLKIIKKVRELNIKYAYNITVARGFVNDEITILSGANKFFTLSSKHKYLGNYPGKNLSKMYDEILFDDLINEYEKIIKLICNITGANEDNILFKNNKTFKKNIKLQGNDEYITVSPFTTNKIKDWPVENYEYIVQELSRYINIILLGSSSQEHKLKKLKGNRKNVYYKIYTLDVIPDIINSSKLFIGNDSGLTHIAYRLGKPTMILLGGGCYGKYFPFKNLNEKSKYYYKELPCFGCDWECIHIEPYCITEISKELVLNNILNYLNINVKQN